jgi:hypothetical protein
MSEIAPSASASRCASRRHRGVWLSLTGTPSSRTGRRGPGLVELRHHLSRAHRSDSSASSSSSTAPGSSRARRRRRATPRRVRAWNMASTSRCVSLPGRPTRAIRALIREAAALQCASRVGGCSYSSSIAVRRAPELAPGSRPLRTVSERPLRRSQLPARGRKAGASPSAPGDGRPRNRLGVASEKDNSRRRRRAAKSSGEMPANMGFMDLHESPVA